VPRQPGEDVRDLVTGVDDDRVQGFQIRQESAVATQRSDGEGLTEQTGRHPWMLVQRALG
jgi:hypothetical protein